MRIFVLGSYVNAHCLHVARLPSRGESLAAETMWTEHGGKGLNLAVGMHRLGAQVDTLLPIGEDSAADAVLHYLQTEGLDTRWVVRTGGQSGFGVGFVDPGGANFLAVHAGANALLDASHVAQAAAALAMADLVCAQFEIPEAPILAAFRHARSRNIRTLLNPSPWRVPGPELLALTDILVLNESEAARLFGPPASTGLSPAEWLDALPAWADSFGWRGDCLAVTLGALGCVALAGRAEAVYQPAPPVTAVDTTGAGDAFSAGLATASARGKSLPDALQWACACGAWVAARRGVLQALPTTEQIEAFI